MFQRLSNSLFIRQIGTVGIGSVGAQIVALLSIPIITRFFEPAHYAVVALISAIAAVFSPIAAGRYEVAIVVSRNRFEAIQIVGIAIWFSVATFSVLFFFQHLFYEYFRELFSAENAGLYIYLVPFLILSSSIFSVYRYYANSKQEYKILSG